MLGCWGKAQWPHRPLVATRTRRKVEVVVVALRGELKLDGEVCVLGYGVLVPRVKPHGGPPRAVWLDKAGP